MFWPACDRRSQEARRALFFMRMQGKLAFLARPDGLGETFAELLEGEAGEVGDFGEGTCKVLAQKPHGVTPPYAKLKSCEVLYLADTDTLLSQVLY
eukprot:4460407-Amphidinium_carterae.1